MPMQDSRKYIRITDFLDVNYHVIQPPDGTYSTCSENISEGGVCLPTDQNLQPGMILKLEIHIPSSSNPVIAIAEIVWVKESAVVELKRGVSYRFVMGLKFNNIEPTDYKAVMGYIKAKT